MIDLTDYQRRLVHSNGQRILVGGRQVGKTETVVQTAISEFSENSTVVVIGPLMSLVRMIFDRVHEELPHTRADKQRGIIDSKDTDGGVVVFDRGSSSFREIFGGLKPDAVLVDESNHVDQELLFRIERRFDDVLLTATPVRPRTATEVWADDSPFWDVEHVPSYDAPFVSDGHLGGFTDTLNDEEELLEVEAKYDDSTT